MLIATSMGLQAPILAVESTLAVALTLRGARVHLLLCDQALPACQPAHITRFRDTREYLEHGPRHRLCTQCYPRGRTVLERLGLPLHRYTDWIEPDAIESARREAAAVPLEEIPTYCPDGLSIGEHAWATTLRFVTRGDLEGVEEAEALARQNLASALLTAGAMQRLFTAHDFEHAVFNHGIYVPQGIIGEVARQRGVHVVNWKVGYRNRTFMFGHERAYHYTMPHEPPSRWEGLDWNEALDRQTVEYLESRAYNAKDWVKYHDRPVEDVAAIEAELGIDFSRPTVALLTNVVWDAQLDYRGTAFPNMIEWTLETIRYFENRPDLQLVIRVHPGELKGTLGSRQPIEAEIRRVYPELPANVALIPPDSSIGTYAVTDQCDAALIYGTKLGAELAARGIPVIVAGEAWARGKGFTLDAESEEEYFTLLDRLPLGERMPESGVRAARKYCYHFYFRRMIPWPFMEPTGGMPPFRLELGGMDDLQPGRHAGLDLVCDGILNGSDFVYPAERAHRTFAAAAESG